MDAPETVTAAVQSLRDEGYEFDGDVRDGHVVLKVDDEWAGTGVVDVERIHRFEGTSDPGDESIVLGIHDHGTDRRGILVTAFGPDTEPDTADCLRALMMDRRWEPGER